ncbi:MAG: hypothetical protein P4L66_02040 [Acetobacteraceae bacterium]|nr:hypothetical protein [Acetobacteraceae bacterium]
MMSIPFDTLKLARQLRESGGFTPEHAEATAEALAEAVSDGVAEDVRATRNDVHTLSLKVDAMEHKVTTIETDVKNLKIGVATLQTDTAVLKWMMGFVLAILVAIFVKLYVH